MTVWSDDASQVRLTESCVAETWRLVGWAGGLSPVAAWVGVTSWPWAWTVTATARHRTARTARIKGEEGRDFLDGEKSGGGGVGVERESPGRV